MGRPAFHAESGACDNWARRQSSMPQEVQVGTILMSEWPQLLKLEGEPYSGRWSMVRKSDTFALNRKVRAAGWNFFFIASEVKVIFFWRPRGEQNPARIASDSRQGRFATLQWPRSDRNRCQAFSGSTLRHRFRALAPSPTELLSGRRRNSALIAARCNMGQSLIRVLRSGNWTHDYTG